MCECTLTKAIIHSFDNWEVTPSGKLLSKIIQNFFYCFISMHYHSGLHAKIQSEHRAIDFGELERRKKMYDAGEESRRARLPLVSYSPHV